MSYEALWYSGYDGQGNAPHCRRLCRLEMPVQWRAAIDLAVAHAEGLAGYRNTSISMTGEEYWHWPDGPEPSESGWWLIPYRIARRCHELCKAATTTALRRGRGSCSSAEIGAVLRRWRRTGRWRQIAAPFWPRHGEDKPFFKPTKRGRGRPRKEPDAKIVETAADFRAAYRRLRDGRRGFWSVRPENLGRVLALAERMGVEAEDLGRAADRGGSLIRVGPPGDWDAEDEEAYLEDEAQARRAACSI